MINLHLSRIQQVQTPRKNRQRRHTVRDMLSPIFIFETNAWTYVRKLTGLFHDRGKNNLLKFASNCKFLDFQTFPLNFSKIFCSCSGAQLKTNMLLNTWYLATSSYAMSYNFVRQDFICFMWIVNYLYKHI